MNIESLKAAAMISIQTANSVYEFSVVDPENCAGILKGGVLGMTSVTAHLLGSASDKNDAGGQHVLAVGEKAVFLCQSINGMRRVVTSRVRALSCNRDAESEQCKPGREK